MRWLLPLILALALAVRAADHVPVRKRKRARGAYGDAAIYPSGYASATAQGRISLHDPDVPGFEDRQTAAVQSATFDAATGTLTWLDENYN